MKYLTILALAAAPYLYADPQTITWTGGIEWAVPGAPNGYGSLHYGGNFSTTSTMADGLYLVTLHFIEPSVHAEAARLFDVYINDQRVLANVDVFARAGFMTPMSRSIVVSVTGGKMVFQFKASVRSALISGIDVYLITP